MHVRDRNFEKDERLGRIFEQDLKPDRILDELQFYLDRPIDRRLDLVILDEIQRSSRALSSLKYFSEEMPEMALCAAGSLLIERYRPPRAYILSANNISQRNIVRYLPLYAAGRL
jgi:hypothetical protein